MDAEEKNKKLFNEKRNLNRWCIANIILFFVSILFFVIGMSTFKYLINANEYTLGIGMIFFLPVILLFIAGFATLLGIIAFIFEIISIRKIFVGNVNNIFKIFSILELVIYVFFVFFLIIK